MTKVGVGGSFRQLHCQQRQGSVLQAVAIAVLMAAAAAEAADAVASIAQDVMHMSASLWVAALLVVGQDLRLAAFMTKPLV